jgi:hypothetical protein
LDRGFDPHDNRPRNRFRAIPLDLGNPHRFFGRITNVRGGLSGISIRIDFNTSGTYQLKGTLEKDKIVGTFSDPRRGMYDFRAVRVPAKG